MEKMETTIKSPLIHPEGIATTFFIDAVAYLLTRMVSTAEMQRPAGRNEHFLSDYTKLTVISCFPLQQILILVISP